MAELMTIKSILEQHDFDKDAMIYLSDNGNQDYPFLILRNGKDRNDGKNNHVDRNLLLLDMVELKKLLTPQKNNKDTFHEKLVNNISAYKNNEPIADEMRMELILAWKTMFNQLRTMIEPLIEKGGLVAVPNPQYFADIFNANKPDYTKIREEFYSVLKQSIINNYVEAEKINKDIKNEEEKVQCSEEYRAYLARISKREILKMEHKNYKNK